MNVKQAFNTLSIVKYSMHFCDVHEHIDTYIQLIQSWTCNESTFNWIFSLLLCSAVGKYKVFAHANLFLSLTLSSVHSIFFSLSIHFCWYLAFFTLYRSTYPTHTHTHPQNYRTNEYLNKSIQCAFRTVPHLIHSIRITNTNVSKR